jgi:uncharacterized membrane protein YcaP (DUF421 family)
VDPLRIIVRVVFAYLVLLVFMRLAGKRAVKQATPFDFTLALILGDLLDDAIWAEVQTSVFVMAAGVLVFVHVLFDTLRYRASLVRRSTW